MPNWKDDRNGESSEIRLGEFRLSIHHWIGCGPLWFATCHRGPLEKRQLEAVELEGARPSMNAVQQEVLHIVHQFKPDGLSETEALLNVIENHAAKIRVLIDRVTTLENALHGIAQRASTAAKSVEEP